jgi:hypothetical protein
MDSLSGYTADDDLAIEPLRELGWEVETVSWRNTTTDWNKFEAVVIRTTWDYQRDPDKFLTVLRTIESSTARLENSLDIVRGNLNKAYLRGLQADGIRIVPTIWNEQYDESSADRWFREFGTDEIIIKPEISATAEYTFRLKTFDPDLDPIFAARAFLVQPFMPNIVTEGEFSLFYFAGEYSHAILKSPKSTDFRVQEEHGGTITAVAPSAGLRRAGRNAFDTISPTPLYARVDFVRIEDDDFALMELELIEPALYLRMDEGAPQRFAAAFDRMMSHTQ